MRRYKKAQYLTRPDRAWKGLCVSRRELEGAGRIGGDERQVNGGCSEDRKLWRTKREI